MNKLVKITPRILFIAAGEPSASSRYRAEQFVQFSIKHNQTQKYKFFAIQPSQKIEDYGRSIYLFFMIIRKVYSLFLCKSYDIIFLQRNPVKLFSPYYEWIIKNAIRKKVVFDFDDNLWVLTSNYDRRIDKILQIADIVIVGNQYLRNKALSFNPSVFVVPTVVDTDSIPSRVTNLDSTEPVVVCWSGSLPSNKYVENIEHVFIKIKNMFGDSVKFIFISNVNLNFKSFVDFEFVKWNVEAEKKVLSHAHVGLMPLEATELAKGKCGFKLILYGAYSLALVASPVGVNNEIVIKNQNGFLPENITDWVDALSVLIKDKLLLKNFMKSSRIHIEKNYSLSVHARILETIILKLED